MEKRVHYYVSRKNALTWLMALCLVGSAVARIVFACVKGAGVTGNVWSQIVLPVAATLLYVLITMFFGKEQFYKTAIPVWMMAFYYAIIPHRFIGDNTMMLVLYCAVLVLCSVIYTIVTAGRIHRRWLLLLIFLSGMGMTLVTRESLEMEVWEILPDVLVFAGVTVLIFALRIHPLNEYHPTWGDRTDGRRIRSLPPISSIGPYIMPNRNGANILYEESLEITQVDRYIRRKRKEGLTNFGIIHVMLAGYVRALCKYPAANRFLSGQKLYSRGNDVIFCMTIKKDMTADSPDTVIKVHFTTSDTAEDIYRKLQHAIETEKASMELDSGIDNLAGILNLIPGIFLKFVVWLLKTLDYFGLVPQALLNFSPFHGSVYFTSMGSLGIAPVYHHLYDFGNIPIFGAFGIKRKELQVQEDGSIVQRKYVDCRFNLDERICDGFYYASFFKHFKRIMAHPDILDNPPDEILKDID